MTRLSLFACTGTLLFTACSGDDDAAAPAASHADAGSDAPLEAAPAPEAGPPADAGSFSVVDVPDTPCEPPGASAREIYPAPATRMTPRALFALGARRAMQLDEGFVLFDADGSNASADAIATPFSVTAIATSPSMLFALGGDGAALSAARYDATGAQAGGALDVAAATQGFGAGGGGGTVLVAWVDGSVLRARAFAEDGTPAGDPFVFRQGLAETEAAAFSVAHAGGAKYGVAYVGERDGVHRLVFTRVSTTQRVRTSWTLLLGSPALRLVSTAHGSKGFALVVQRSSGQTAPESLLVTLDEDGRFAGPARRLVGVRRAFGVAASGDELAVVAWRTRTGDAGEPEPDAIEVRRFDEAGAPLGAWVCLDAAFATAAPDVGAAILGEDDGWSIAMRTPTSAVALARISRSR